MQAAMSCTVAPGSYRAVPMPVSSVSVPGVPGPQSFQGLRTAPQAVNPRAVYAAPIAGAGGPDSAESPRSVDSEGPFTRGFPDPTSIEEQKLAYCRSLEHQLEEGNKSLQQQNIERKKQLHEAAEQQKQALLLHMEQQVKMQEMALDEQTNHALMGLKKAALDQRAALEQQAASLTLEYQQRKMQEEFAATQAEMQRQYVDSATKLHSEVQQNQYESKSKMQREWERQLKERHEVLGPASMNMPQYVQLLRVDWDSVVSGARGNDCLGGVHAPRASASTYCGTILA